MFNFKEFKKYEINNILINYINEIQNYDEYFFQTRDKNQYKVISKINRTILQLELVFLSKEFIEIQLIKNIIIQFMKNLILIKEQKWLMI